MGTYQRRLRNNNHKPPLLYLGSWVVFPQRNHRIKMDETKENNDPANVEKRNSEDSFPWEEWTVLDDGEDPKYHSTSQLTKSSTASSDSSYSNIDNTSDAEEARECIQVLPPDILEQSPSLTSREESVDQHNDESDGVSVITESDVDEGIADANVDTDVLYNRVNRAEIRKLMADTDSNMNKAYVMALIFALLAGFGIGAMYGIAKDFNRSNPTESTLLALKMDKSRLLEQLKEFNGVKDILEQIKSNMLTESRSDTSNVEKPAENEAKSLPYLIKQFEALDPSIKNQDNALYERMQIFSRTICLLLGDIRQPNSDSENFQTTCETHSRFSDLKNLHVLLNSVIDGLEPSEKSTHQRFLQNIDFQINSMSDSFLADLTRALDKLNVKNQKRLGKIGFKVNERLCVLRNTLPSDSKIRQSLEKNNTFLDNCEKIAERKSADKSKENWKGSSASLRSSKDEKKNSKKRETPVIPNFNKKPRGYLFERQNATSLYETVETRKCYNNNLPSFMHDSQDAENTCAMLMAPPRSDWKLKHKSFKVDLGKGEKDKRRKLVEEWPGKILMKGDRGASKIWKKTSTMKFEKTPKTSGSSYEDIDKETMKKMKERMNTKIHSRAVLSEPPSNNPEGKHKRKHPPTPTVHRVKKSFEKENNEFIVVERRDANSKFEGDWQFERRSYRSRIRDQLRNDDSTGNWYFDRVGNRKNSRLNCDNSNQDPRCGKLHH